MAGDGDGAEGEGGVLGYWSGGGNLETPKLNPTSPLSGYPTA